MDPKRKINDDYLDALLREVELPADLKDQLRAIPSQIKSVELSSNGRSWHTSGRLLAISAALLAIAGFLTWSWMIGNDAADPPVAKDDNTKSSTEVDPKETETTRELPERQPETIPEKATRLADNSESGTSVAEQLETLTAEIELQELRSRLASLEAESRRYLPASEYEALVQALANQSSLELGGDESRIRREMLGIMTNYPNTRGAEYARQFVDNNIRN